MHVLVLNAGSSTLKWSLLDGNDPVPRGAGEEPWQAHGLPQRAEQIRATLRRVAHCGAVGHRVVHGGARFTAATLVDRRTRAALEELVQLDPLHMRPALAGIDAVSQEWPSIPQVAAFDTAFHAQMPLAAARYAIPYEWTERWGLRRFGFHGLSVAHSLQVTRDMLGRTPRHMIVCHLGSGCSLTALLDGRSVDTTMGFSPLEGVTMATRSGSIDPGLVMYLQSQGHMSAPDLFDALQNRCGLLGLSGISSDLRRVLDAADGGSARAQLAYDQFVWTLRRAAGAMTAVLGGLEAIVFTGGIGENAARVRQDVAVALGFAGLRLLHRDDGRGDRVISTPDSTVSALVVHAREDLPIVAAVHEVLGMRDTS
jgi:acetate kinase